jgi:hypothetical protein
MIYSIYIYYDRSAGIVTRQRNGRPRERDAMVERENNVYLL